MSKIIQYLTQNPTLIPLFLNEKICFVGLENDVDRKALVDVLTAEVTSEPVFWK
ncbi:competence pheromone ComX [Sporosarcina sp. FSL K6-2383]|uniref:competence pheromone ComX n=1 Tax=Sporosarcina sp. FSL K6-2383 TaxID=2921556 RepID=UPI00315A7F3E